MCLLVRVSFIYTARQTGEHTKAFDVQIVGELFHSENFQREIEPTNCGSFSILAIRDVEVAQC